jgi:LPS O-antigen subunit length determinant protein (WzzB/FepE family)
MGQCAGIKRDGNRCTVVVNGSREHCYQHDPTKAEQRRRSAFKAGKSKPSKEIVAIRGRLSDLADDVLAGRVDRADAAVAGQLLNYVIRAVSVEMKVKEVTELEERLEALELAAQIGGMNGCG